METEVAVAGMSTVSFHKSLPVSFSISHPLSAYNVENMLEVTKLTSKVCFQHHTLHASKTVAIFRKCSRTVDFRIHEHFQKALVIFRKSRLLK